MSGPCLWYKKYTLAQRVADNCGTFSEESLESLKASCGPYDWVDGATLAIQNGFPEFPTANEIVFGSVSDEAYSGSFHLVWARDGKLYEMAMSHCSCNSYAEDYHYWQNLQPINGAYLINENKYLFATSRETPFFQDVIEEVSKYK